MTSYEDRSMSEVLERYGSISDEIELLAMYGHSKEDDGFTQFTEEDYRECVNMDMLFLREHSLHGMYEHHKDDLGTKFRDFEEFCEWASRFQNFMKAFCIETWRDYERSEKLMNKVSERRASIRGYSTTCALWI